VELKDDEILNHPKRKEEIVKILLQALGHLGMEKTVNSLSEETQIHLENE
jgi:hypothetical protein